MSLTFHRKRILPRRRHFATVTTIHSAPVRFKRQSSREKPGIFKSTDANVQLASFQTLVKVSLRSVCINKKTTLTKNQPCLNLNAVNVKIHGEIPHVSQCLLCVVIVGCWKKNVSLTNAKVKRVTKSSNFFCNIAAKLVEKQFCAFCH